MLCSAKPSRIRRTTVYEKILTKLIKFRKTSIFNLTYQYKDLGILIKDAFKLKVINNETKEKLYQIKRIRNYTVHELENFSSETTLELIIMTKDIIEGLYSL